MCYLKQNWDVTHEELRAIAKEYIILQEKRQAMKQSTDQKPSKIGYWLKDQLTALKKELVKRFEDQLEGHPLLEWCKITKGLGPTSALIYAGFIDPHKAESPSKVFAYWGFTPEGKRKPGKKIKGRPELKRNAWFFAKAVIMKKDPYYTPLWQAKKEYLLNREDIKNKPKARKAIADGKATYWLAKILLSNAWEKLREGCLLPGCQHKHPYIPPKRRPDSEPSPKLLDIILKGERKPYPDKPNYIPPSD